MAHLLQASTFTATMPPIPDSGNPVRKAMLGQLAVCKLFSTLGSVEYQDTAPEIVFQFSRNLKVENVIFQG
jgi:hypothetical protein